MDGRSECVTADAAGGGRVFPLDGPSVGGVGVDVAAESASQIGYGRDDSYYLRAMPSSL